MKTIRLNEDEIESAKCSLIDETSDFILDRVFDVMHDHYLSPIGDGEVILDDEQIDEVVTSVFKGLYYEKAETKQ